MKKIINGKMYNTETAEFIGEDSYSNLRDFNYYADSLYRKKNGEFFLVGEGGPNSKYSREVGTNEWSGTHDNVILLSQKEAEEWIETHCSADIYISLFGEPEE